MLPTDRKRLEMIVEVKRLPCWREKIIIGATPQAIHNI